MIIQIGSVHQQFYTRLAFHIDNTELHFSMAKLYSHEPVGIQQVYSERYLQQCRLEVQGDHTYKLHLPDNKANYYTYKDRLLAAVTIERTWFNLEFRKK